MCHGTEDCFTSHLSYSLPDVFGGVQLDDRDIDTCGLPGYAVFETLLLSNVGFNSGIL